MKSPAAPTIEVWLATEATDHRAMHDVIAIYTPEYTYVLEPAGWSDDGPVTAVLAAGGFQGGPGSGLSVREVACDVPIVPVRGFTAPASMLATLKEVVARALTGRLGGFFPVLAGQAFFHRSAMAFEYAWAAAGRPPVKVRPPDLVTGLRSEDGTPGPVDHAASVDPRVAAARRRPEPPEEPEEEPLDPWTRGPVEGEDPGLEEVLFAEEIA
jgi:hypothetical protein